MKRWQLATAGATSFGISLLHVFIIFAGADAYRYFGAGEEMARSEVEGSFVPATVTSIVALAFAIIGLYGFSGAGLIRRLPALKAILVIVTVIYLLRGVAFFIEVEQIATTGDTPLRFAVFSLVSLIVGILFLLGLKRFWREI